MKQRPPSVRFILKDSKKYDTAHAAKLTIHPEAFEAVPRGACVSRSEPARSYRTYEPARSQRKTLIYSKLACHFGNRSLVPQFGPRRVAAPPTYPPNPRLCGFAFKRHVREARAMPAVRRAQMGKQPLGR